MSTMSLKDLMRGSFVHLAMKGMTETDVRPVAACLKTA